MVPSSSSESDELIALHNSSSDLDWHFSDDENDDNCEEETVVPLNDDDFAVVKVHGKTKDVVRLYAAQISCVERGLQCEIFETSFRNQQVS